MLLARLIVSLITKNKGSEKMLINAKPVVYFLRKKCPAPGYINADNKTTFIDLFTFDLLMENV